MIVENLHTVCDIRFIRVTVNSSVIEYDSYGHRYPVAYFSRSLVETSLWGLDNQVIIIIIKERGKAKKNQNGTAQKLLTILCWLKKVHLHQSLNFFQKFYLEFFYL